MTPDTPRLIERAFPLKQASLDSMHEKLCHKGHPKALHIWPARRPLAACRASLVATLLPEPTTAKERKDILERLGGKIVKVPKQKRNPNGQVTVEYEEETEGGILRWGNETSPDVQWFRDVIRAAFHGRPPRLMDPFAGGGAIPLEAMRLGCEVTAVDLNPVAWFILKCTLDYPQKLAGQKRPLPRFALESNEFMLEYWKANGKYSKKQLDAKLEKSQTLLLEPPEANLAWHVRAWGWWVLERATKDLRKYYPTVDGKPTVAYLWARMVTCKNCRATIPLLKTQWLCKKDNKRALLTMEPNKGRTGVVFGTQEDVPVVGANAAQRREYDKRIGQGTMSRNGAWCPCCGQPGTVAMQMEDIRQEGRAGRLQVLMTAVVVAGEKGKDYRLPTEEELQLAAMPEKELPSVFAGLPFGLPDEPTPKGGIGASRAFSVDGYGLDKWSKLFTPRQLLALGTFVKHTRAAREALQNEGYGAEWIEAIVAYLACVINKVADYNSALVAWQTKSAKGSNTFSRWALPMKTDFVENALLTSDSGGWTAVANWVTDPLLGSINTATEEAPSPRVINGSALKVKADCDFVLTDPPYYDAIPYSDLMDFFYVWLRRTLYGFSNEWDQAFEAPLAPKWDHEAHDGELIDDASRHSGNKATSKSIYEEGMFRAFQASHACLRSDGRLVIVFAHKNPDAWETLVAAIIRAGFVVDGSWPIQTEMGNRTRSQTSAALSSTVWLVCRKRPETARPGWDNQILEEMRSKIHQRLQEFWDAGIRGPDFVWAATGPALEAYSKHPIVKKANEPGAVMTVSEFLRHVRRIVVDFVVGRVLSRNGDGTSAVSLDDVTTYYLLHRHDFGFDDAPAGACIMYAVSCGLSDTTLSDEHDLLVRTGGTGRDEQEGDKEASGNDDGEAEVEEGSGSTVRLKAWNQRKRKRMGDDVNGKPAPIIDRIHRLMHLWRAGDVVKVNEHLDEHGLVRNATFHQVLQAIIELSKEGSEERSLLESLSNHVAAKGGIIKKPRAVFEYSHYPGIREGGKPE